MTTKLAEALGHTYSALGAQTAWYRVHLTGRVPQRIVEYRIES